MISKELVAASSRGLVLSILSEGPSYGYAIIQRVRELSDEELRWTDGMLYPVLHRLEKEGLIKSEWRESESGRERKYYALTGPGRKARQQEQNDWLAVHNTMAKLWVCLPGSVGQPARSRLCPWGGWRSCGRHFHRILSSTRRESHITPALGSRPALNREISRWLNACAASILRESPNHD